MNNLVMLRRAPTLAWASRLMFAGGVVNAAGAVSGLLQAGTLVRQLQDRLAAFGEASQTFRANIWWLGPATLIFTLVVLTLHWVWMAWKNHQGRAWARTLVSAFAVLGVAGGVVLLVSSREDNVAISVTVFVLLGPAP